MHLCESGDRPDGDAAERRVASVIDALRDACTALDEMWRDAVSGEDGARLVGLGDASYGVHLALVALEDSEAELRAHAS
ncbi:MAG TPA: hypothetical protein VMU14_12740 [Acidimicrobiales bacterium]|nr:hypothetical protein [Acidimicrobiales bacterium]